MEDWGCRDPCAWSSALESEVASRIDKVGAFYHWGREVSCAPDLGPLMPPNHE